MEGWGVRATSAHRVTGHATLTSNDQPHHRKLLFSPVLPWLGSRSGCPNPTVHGTPGPDGLRDRRARPLEGFKPPVP
eukprot:756356-Hanusia_phi.AAC.2